ncbi:hypothetical protein 10S11_75 [uncultured Caudovirales phage]|uniref:Uncharacterized protein n=1 Tax=uncultured Caudovirales phage TaxID=2100421 RepID=A0A2H4J4U5_9CAUD|nr:hypothetical protein 10S11_75 [uncultured Caudovirales phage]
MSKTVTISAEEYNNLLKKEKFLEALENRGVDNWDGYSEAYKSVYGEE